MSDAAPDDSAGRGLDRHQLEAVTDPATPIRIIAGAGSGKTRVLTRRIAHRVISGDADAGHVVAVTFTRRAAIELRRRLHDLGLRDEVTAGTFHSLAWGQLHDLWETRGVAPAELLDRPTRLIARLLPSATRDHAAEVAAEISWAGARALGPDDLAAARDAAERPSSLPAEVVADVWRAYTEAKKAARCVDFDDVLRLATRAVLSDPDHARALRWRWRHFFVDEFQDLNRRQLRLLRAWLGDRRDLCVVGDPNQAIYAWNGADPRYLTRLDEIVGPLTTVHLRTNHRSTAQIVACAHAVVSPHGGIPPTASSGPGNPPVVHRYESEDSEATHLARRVRDRHRPDEPWAIQAVLVRTHAQATPIVAALARAGIPHRLRGTGALLARPAVARVLRDLSTSDRPLTEALRDLTDDVAEMRAADPESAGDLALVAELAGEHLVGDPRATSAAFAALLRAGAEPDLAPRSADAVDIVTFHAAKGLEWPVVHICGLEEGFAPISHARTVSQRDEERRLVHVAITRATTELHLSWAATRRFGERTVERRRSPYLDDVERALERMGVGAQAADRSAVRRARRRLDERIGSSPSPDPATHSRVLADLRDWRLRIARGSDVTPSAVIDDGALAAIARAMPSDTRTLTTVTGLGAARIRRLAPAILEIVDRHR